VPQKRQNLETAKIWCRENKVFYSIC